MKVKVSVGQKVPVSGQYRPNGENYEVTFVKGNKVPPYRNSKKFTLVDKTKHRK